MRNINKIHIILSVSALISLILIMFFIYPAFKDIEKNSQDLISAKNDIVILGAQIEETKKFKEDYENYRPNLEKIDELFIDPDNPVDFIKFLEDKAEEYNLDMQISLSLLSSGQKGFVSFVFSLKGSLPDVLKFLSNIEQGVYLIEIEKLTIQDSLKKTVEATLTVKALKKI